VPRLNARQAPHSFVWDAPHGLINCYCDSQPLCVHFIYQLTATRSSLVFRFKTREAEEHFFLPFAWETVLLDAVVHTHQLGYRR